MNQQQRESYAAKIEANPATFMPDGLRKHVTEVMQPNLFPAYKPEQVMLAMRSVKHRRIPTPPIVPIILLTTQNELTLLYDDLTDIDISEMDDGSEPE